MNADAIQVQFQTEVQDLLAQIEQELLHLADDPNSQSVSEMIKVSSIGEELESVREWETAKSYFAGKKNILLAWVTYLETGKHAPFSFKKTSFINLFHGDTVLLLDMYRPPWKKWNDTLS